MVRGRLIALLGLLLVPACTGAISLGSMPGSGRRSSVQGTP